MSIRSDPLFVECLLFVQCQSAGEWGAEVEAKDALELTRFVRAKIAQAIEARSDATPKSDAAEGESAVPARNAP